MEADENLCPHVYLSNIRSNNHIRVTNCINIETSFPNFKHIMNTIGMKINEED